VTDGANVWEQNYTNWFQGFSYGDRVPGDYVWHGNYKVAYLCMSALNFTWLSCPAYTTSVYAYVCEARGNAAPAAPRTLSPLMMPEMPLRAPTAESTARGLGESGRLQRVPSRHCRRAEGRRETHHVRGHARRNHDG
jgi:hypothetical protein